MLNVAVFICLLIIALCGLACYELLKKLNMQLNVIMAVVLKETDSDVKELALWVIKNGVDTYGKD